MIKNKQIFKINTIKYKKIIFNKRIFNNLQYLQLELNLKFKKTIHAKINQSNNNNNTNNLSKQVNIFRIRMKLFWRINVFFM